MSGHWLAVELDIARWNEDKALLPDFSSPTMLKSVLDQVAWLSAGKPCPMEWSHLGNIGIRCYPFRTSPRRVSTVIIESTTQ